MSSEGSSIISELTELIVVANSGNSSFVVQTDSIPALYVDAGAKVGINTLNPTRQLEVQNADGECFRIRHGGSQAFADLSVDSIGDVNLNTGSTANNVKTNGSLNIVNHNGSTIGLKLGGDLVKASADELNFNVVTPGTAAASKALVVDENKSISGISSISSTSISGTLQTAAQPNITSVGTLSNLDVSGVLSASSLSGTLQTASQPNITSVGTLSSLNVSGGISASSLSGTLQTAAQPNITSIGNLSSISVGGNSISSEVAFLSGAVAGAAANSKVLILSSTGTISGIGSLTATNLFGQLQTAAQPNITSIGTLNNLTVVNDVVASTLTGTIQTGPQPNITSLGNLSSITISGSTIGAEAAFLSGVVAGSAASSKALVLNSLGSVSGITALSASRLTGQIQTPAQPLITSLGNLTSLTINGSTINSEAAFLAGSTAGTASPSKVLVVNSNKSIGGIESLSAISLSGTLQTAAQPNITSVGTLNGIQVDSSAVFTSTTEATSSTMGAATFSGGVGIAKSIWVGNGIYGAVMTASQPNITSLGSLSELNVSGAVNITGTIMLNGVELTASGNGNAGSGPDYVLGITPGVAAANKALVLNNEKEVSGISSLSSTKLLGTIFTPAQPRITSIGNLSSLNILGNVIRSEAGFLADSVAGSAVAGKVLVVDSSKDISGINNISAANLNLTGAITINGQPLSSSSGSSSPYLDDITPGTVAASKALVVDANKDISGVRNLTLSNTSNILKTFDANNIQAKIAGTQWDLHSIPNSVGSNHVVYAPALKLYASVGPYFPWYSVNGKSWAIGKYDATLTETNWKDVTWSEELGLFIAVSDSGNAIMKSSDGINWTKVTIPAPPALYAVCWSPELGLFVAVGLNTPATNSILTSPNGNTWTVRQSPITASVRWMSVCWSPDLSLFVAVGNTISGGGTATSKIIVSSDGITWTSAVDPNPAFIYNCVTWASGLGKFVASVNTTSTIVTSSNGINWTINTISVNGVLDTLTWNSDLQQLVASIVSQTNVAITSDLLIWNLYNTKVSNAILATSIIWNTAHKTYLISSGNAVAISHHVVSNTNVSFQESISQDDSNYSLSSSNATGSFKFIKNNQPLLTVDSRGLVLPEGTILNSQKLSQLEVVPGVASASKFLLLNDLADITSIRNLTITGNFKINNTSITDAQLVYLTGITPGTAIASKALIVDANKSISSLNGVSAVNMNLSGSLTVNGQQLTSTNLGYITSVTPGTASASKALVLSSTSDISGINNLSAANVNVSGSFTINGQPLSSESSPYTTDVVPGTASALKALVLDSAKDISGINTLSATTLTGTLSTGAQTGITSVGTLTSLSVSGDITIGSTILSESELAVVDAVTPGTASASKALVLSSAKDITGINTLSAANIDVTGSITVNGQPLSSGSGSGSGSSGTSDIFLSTREYAPNGIDAGANFIGNWPNGNSTYFGLGAHDISGNKVRIGISSATGVWASSYPNVYSGSFTSVSDYRIKENIIDIPYGIEEVKRLKPVKYNMKGSDDNIQIGFIAHEVQSVIPEVVSGTKDEVDSNGDAVHQGVHYANLTALLVKAVQEQQDMIQSLKSEIEDLKKRMN